GIHSPEGAVWAEENGIRRIILARELHLAELEKIRKSTKLELEVFIHGALCYSFSGQCLFSSTIGGRSGNRGICTQPCRKLYTIGKKKGYMLSTADIFGIEAIPELLRIGVNGLKIEGRMRSPLYVYLTSRIYKEAIGRAKNGVSPLITDREKELLDVVFNRGFSGGYLLEDNIMQREYAGSRGLPLGDFDFDGKEGLVRSDQVTPHDGITFFRNNQKIGGFEIGEAEKRNGFSVLYPPFKLAKGRYQLYKTKDHEFETILEKIKAMEFPSEAPKKYPFRKLSFRLNKRAKTRGDLSFYVSSLKSLERIIPYADRVYFEWNNNFGEASKACSQAGIDIVLLLPRLMFGSLEADAESVMINSVDQYEENRNRRLYGHYSMNFFNSLTVPELYQYTVSPELSREDIMSITSHYAGRLEAMVFGKIELMISRDSSLGEGMLIDQKMIGFPVYRDRFALTHILNSSDLFLMDYLDDLEEMGINSFGIDLRRREPSLSEIVAKAFYQRDLSKKAEIKKLCGSITARHYLRGVE
ncbi:U32 family peptidase, partial [Candidatus Bathyarchaeota archaeon]|nr:U32 family peptidase [Candidatus Bathyarchaeota archaeon]